MRQPVAAVVIAVAAVVAGSLLAAGCRAEATRDQLARRAAFDLGCSAGELRYTRIDERTVKVLGCGKHGTYVESCDGLRTNASTTCTWVLNGKLEVDRSIPPDMDPDPGDVAAPTP